MYNDTCNVVLLCTDVLMTLRDGRISFQSPNKRKSLRTGGWWFGHPEIFGINESKQQWRHHISCSTPCIGVSEQMRNALWFLDFANVCDPKQHTHWHIN